MEYKLIPLHLDMGRPEYEMYQEIPAKESGSTNLCHGLPFEVFPAWLENQMARKHQTISFFDTPTTVYLLYADGIPAGYVGIRTEIDENWKRWCGHIYYTLRPSFRGQGCGKAMLRLALEECRKMGMRQVFVKASEGNTASCRVIEANGGQFTGHDGGSRFYTIAL